MRSSDQSELSQGYIGEHGGEKQPKLSGMPTDAHINQNKSSDELELVFMKLLSKRDWRVDSIKAYE